MGKLKNVFSIAQTGREKISSKVGGLDTNRKLLTTVEQKDGVAITFISRPQDSEGAVLIGTLLLVRYELLRISYRGLAPRT